MRQLLHTFLICFFINSVSAQTSGNNPVSPDNRVYTFVEQMPVFPGGDAGIAMFLRDHIHYPEEQRSDRIQGKVLLRFIIEKDGSVSDVQVIRSANPALDAEAVRVVKQLPKFKPGMQQGLAVRVYYNLPVIFSLAEQKSN